MIRANKLNKILKTLTQNLSRHDIPFAVIGAVALGRYGLPRFTSDIDLLTEKRFGPELQSLMKALGYTLCRQPDAMAHFESEAGSMGYIDFLFVDTPDGKAILSRRVVVEDELLGRYPIIQPTDYLILKMMAAANDPDRRAGDEADIGAFLRFCRDGLVPAEFEELDRERICLFADRFRQRKLVEQYLNRLCAEDDAEGRFGT